MDYNSIDDFAADYDARLSDIDFSPLFPAIENILISSISENFIKGGRYGSGMFSSDSGQFGGGSEKWLPSHRAIRQSGMTLVDTGTLWKSIQVIVEKFGNKINIELRSNLSYASTHQFGNNKLRIKARPYLVVQEEDIQKIKELFVDFIVKLIGNI